MRQMDVHKLQQQRERAEVTVLDVRTEGELEIAALPGAVHIPLDELPQRWHELDATRPLAVICHHGVRSGVAVHWLEHNGFASVSNVVGGIDAWSRDIDPTVPRY